MDREERRQDKRHALAGETVVLTFPHMVVSDTLIDMSRGGLAFLYSSANPLPKDDFYLHIIREETAIEEVPVSIVSDHPVAARPFARRCGVRFAGLDPRLERKIDNLFVTEV